MLNSQVVSWSIRQLPAVIPEAPDDRIVQPLSKKNLSSFTMRLGGRIVQVEKRFLDRQLVKKVDNSCASSCRAVFMFRLRDIERASPVSSMAVGMVRVIDLDRLRYVNYEAETDPRLEVIGIESCWVEKAGACVSITSPNH